MPKPSRHPAVGIDLGTTFSVVAASTTWAGRMTLINAEGDKITPSVVFFEGDNVVVGKEAVKAAGHRRRAGGRVRQARPGAALLSQAARRAAVSARGAAGLDPQQAAGRRRAADRRLQQGRHHRPGLLRRSPPQSHARRRLHRRASRCSTSSTSRPPPPSPSAFSKGFLNPERPRPEAARKILVYDLGGGTFDVTVMEIGGHDFIALATDGDVQLGGKDWDQRLVDFVAEEFIRKFKHRSPRRPQRQRPPVARVRGRQADAVGPHEGAASRCDYKGQAVRVEITRQQFEEMTQDLLDRTAFTTRQTLQAAGLDWTDIDRVLLVGGSTRMPAVVDDAAASCRARSRTASVSPDEAVAHGAALHAGILLDKHEGETPNFKIRNVNSHSLGVVATDTSTTRQRQRDPDSPQHAAAGRRPSGVFKTQKANQQSILVQIVEGESASPDDCSQLGKCVVRNLPPDLPAQTPIEVRFKYEENGRLTVVVAVQGTGAASSTRSLARTV